MYPPDELRRWAVELRAYAAACDNPDHMGECLMLAGRFTDLAKTLEAFMSTLASSGSSVAPWAPPASDG